MKEKRTAPICSECAGATTNIFAECPKDMLGEIFQDKSWVEFPDHQIIFREAQKAQGVYCIYEGIVKLFKKDKSNRDYTINIAQKTDVLGLQAMMNEGERYSISALTLAPTQTCFIPKENFKSLVLDYPMLSLQVMRNISDEIDNIEQKMNKITHRSSPDRLIETLTYLFERFGTDKEGYLKVDLSFQDIADLVGVTRGHLYKILGRFKSEELLRVQHNRIKIQDPAKWEQLTA